MKWIHPTAKSVAFCAGLVLMVGGAPTARAVSPPTASATISETELAANSFQYTLTLTDAANSPSPIGTFWFAWVPGKDFLTTEPTSVTKPAGWQDNITHTGSTDGYAVQWEAVSPPIDDDTAGNTLTGFSFISADAPSSVFGDSSFYPSFPTSTSEAYDAMPFSDAGTPFVTTAITPEPAMLPILAPAALLLCRRWARRGPMRPGSVVADRL
jgi:hypothetical protein